MKILITGAAGFIGSHAAERLAAAGHEVTGIDNFSAYYNGGMKAANASQLENLDIPVLRADLANGDLETIAGTGFDYIFHFAAQPGIADHVTLQDYMHNNMQATYELVQFAQKNSSLRMLVNICTSSVYGTHATGNELQAPEPASMYGITKLAAEQLVLKNSRSGSINACSLRLYSVYGPRERPDKLFSRLINAALTGDTFTLYHGSEQHIRSFTFVDDIVDGVLAVIGREAACNGQIINLGNETEYTTQQGIECVTRLTGRPINIQRAGGRKGDQLHTRADISKAKALLNYHPLTTLEQGLKKQVLWQRDRLVKSSGIIRLGHTA